MCASRQIRIAVVLLTIHCLCCGWPTVVPAQDTVKAANPEKAPEKPELGAVSPEEAFTRYQKAIAADDWKVAFQLQTESSRDYMLGGLVAACHLGALGEEGTKLVSEFVDSVKLKELVAKIMQAPRAEQSKFAGEVAALVAKKPEFMSRALALFKAQKRENWLLGIGDAKLVRLKLKEDRAKAQMEIRLGKGAGSEPMSFRRVDGRWYIDYSNE